MKKCELAFLLVVLLSFEGFRVTSISLVTVIIATSNVHVLGVTFGVIIAVSSIAIVLVITTVLITTVLITTILITTILVTIALIGIIALINITVPVAI